MAEYETAATWGKSGLLCCENRETPCHSHEHWQEANHPKRPDGSGWRLVTAIRRIDGDVVWYWERPKAGRGKGV